MPEQKFPDEALADAVEGVALWLELNPKMQAPPALLDLIDAAKVAVTCLEAQGWMLVDHNTDRVLRPGPYSSETEAP